MSGRRIPTLRHCITLALALLAFAPARATAVEPANLIKALEARGWLPAAGATSGVSGVFTTRWSTDSTLDIVQPDGRGISVNRSGLVFRVLQGDAAGKGKPKSKPGGSGPLPRLLPDGTMVYEYGSDPADRKAVRVSPAGQFYIGDYDLAARNGTGFDENGNKLDGPYRFGMAPSLQQSVRVYFSFMKPDDYYDECPVSRYYMADSSVVLIQSRLTFQNEQDHNARILGMVIPGEGIFSGAIRDVDSWAPWRGVLYTNDRVVGYWNGVRVMETKLGKAAKGDFNVPNIEQAMTFYWNITPEGRVTWDRTVGGLQRYRFWPNGLHGHVDERFKDVAYDIGSVSAAKNAIQDDGPPVLDLKGKVMPYKVKAFELMKPNDRCVRCSGRGAVWTGSYEGFEDVCEGSGGTMTCYKVFKVNPTGMSVCPMCEGTGKK